MEHWHAATATAPQIKASNAGASDEFSGDEVALSNDTLAVGASGEGSCSTSVATTAATDDDCSSAGAVYVYVRSGAAWSFEAYVHSRAASRTRAPGIAARARLREGRAL